MPTNVIQFNANLAQGTDIFIRVLPIFLERRLRPLIEKELKNVPIRSGHLVNSRYLKIRKNASGGVVFQCGWRAFYSRFVGANERLRLFLGGREVQRAIKMALRDSFRAAFGSAVAATLSIT